MKMQFNKAFIALIGLFLSVSASAEDIELYVNHNVETGEKPRVLLIFDTSGSMDELVTSEGESERCYIKNRGWWFGYYDYFEPLQKCYESKSSYSEYNQQCYINIGTNYNPNYQPRCTDEVENGTRLEVAKRAVKGLIAGNNDIDFGLMRFNYNAGNEPGGGYVLAKIGSNENTLVNKINNLPAYGSTPLTETLWEAYLYITGKNIKFAGGVQDRDKSIDNNYEYKSPFRKDKENSLRCDNSINIILITDGQPQNDDEADWGIKQTYKDIFGTNAGSFGSYKSYLVALAKILHGTDTTPVDLYPQTSDVLDTGKLFTIGFGGGMGENALKLLEEAAKVGGGDYFEAKSSAALSSALKNTISQIRKENSTFTSPSVASNNTDQTRSRNAVYFAMFYPETGARWRGNLKKLKVSGSQIVDSSNKQALNSDGLISKDAKTFWLPPGEPADGNAVAQGGVNHYLSTVDPLGRSLYTDSQGSLVDFNTDNVSDILSNIPSNTLSLSNQDVNWARGVDVDDEDKDGSSQDQRADIFGDPLHSKPVAIDYGNDDVRILIGTNAGFLHMFKDAGESVSESWAFMPTVLFDIIKPLRNKQADSKVYGMDGPISVYFSNKSLNSEGLNDGIIDASKGDAVWAFAGMRRGGKNYYALDITNPNAPKKLWEHPIEGGKGDFKELAQTWSKPQIAYIKAFGDEPLLIFGAGYDPNKDAANRSNDNIGRGIYIVEAKTGKRVWALTPEINGFKGKHSIAANITTLDSNYDGYIDRIYAADTGGGIWRIDMPGINKNEFSHFKLAELGSSDASKDRRFFYKPLVARTIYSKVTETSVNGKTVITRLDTPYDAIVIGSGNRSKPTGTNVQDELFMIRDENVTTQSFKASTPKTIIVDDLMLMNTDPFGNALDDVDEFVDLELKLGKFSGWRYELSNGEKSLAAATVVGGVAYFTSFTPASDSSTENQCSLSGGGGSMYAFHLHYGTKVYDDLKFTTSYDVPDTPQLYFGEGPTCSDSNNDGKCDDNPTEDVKYESQFYLIGPGIKGENAENPLKPIEIKGPKLTVVDGKVQLVDPKAALGFGFKTQQTYIYKREENDEVSN